MHTMELFLMVEPISVAKPAVTTALSGSPPKAPGFADGYLLSNLESGISNLECIRLNFSSP